MLRTLPHWMTRSLAGLVIALTGIGASADDSVGRVRISDKPAPIVRGQSSDIPLAPPVEQISGEVQQVSGPCANDYGTGGYGNGGYAHGGSNVVYGPVCEDNCRHMRRNKCGNPNCRECGGCGHGWLARKFGYFFCTGSCGQGTPLVGKYHMVYPHDPNYFDARDGYIYSSQVFNGPVSVPLAPVVHHTYNYGWGVPSSRLTPVSHPTHPY